MAIVNIKPNSTSGKLAVFIILVRSMPWKNKLKNSTVHLGVIMTNAAQII